MDSSVGGIIVWLLMPLNGTFESYYDGPFYVMGNLRQVQAEKNPSFEE